MQAVNLVGVARLRAGEEVSKIGMRLPVISFWCGKVAVVGGDEAVHVVWASVPELGGVQLDQQGVGHAVLVRGERRLFLQASADHPGAFGVGRPQSSALGQKLCDLAKVLRDRRVHQRDVLLCLCEPDVLVLLPGELVQVSAQLPQPVEDTPGDGGLRAGTVALESSHHYHI